MKNDKTGFMQLIVYYDDDYPTVWVQREISMKITSFLKSKNFVEYNAEDLAKWMEESIKKDTCWQSVVVFSQDVVPDTICHAPEPSSLIREYLDCGGRIIWIGDIPLFYFGPHPSRAKTQYADARLIPLTPLSEIPFDGVDFAKASSRVFKDRDGNITIYWGSGACFSILGVMPLYLDFPSSNVSITKRGESFGLKNPWYSIRPIIIKGSNLRNKKATILATTKPLSLMATKKTIFRARVRSLREVKERGISFPSIIDALSKFLGPIVTIGSAVVSIAAGLRGFAAIPSSVWFAIALGLFVLAFVLWFFRWRERFASAWFKNFNNRHPASGFIRLWDFRIHRITDEMLKDLYDVTLAKN
ncbi:hypothetical protein E3J74_05110 [Candidatus Bathyarchaeota archaeon]|nr:MAG: hypothetical protein E3J74_05110 [Candidatus Bathyarchaeota archaeon]